MEEHKKVVKFSLLFFNYLVKFNNPITPVRQQKFWAYYHQLILYALIKDLIWKRLLNLCNLTFPNPLPFLKSLNRTFNGYPACCTWEISALVANKPGSPLIRNSFYSWPDYNIQSQAQISSLWNRILIAYYWCVWEIVNMPLE